TLAEIPEVLWVLQLQAFDTGHGLFCRIGCELSEADFAAARIVDHLVIDRLYLGRRDAPTLGRRGFQHRAGAGADLPHWSEIMPRAARAVSVLVAVSDLVANGLLYVNT